MLEDKAEGDGDMILIPDVYFISDVENPADSPSSFTGCPARDNRLPTYPGCRIDDIERVCVLSNAATKDECEIGGGTV